MPSPSRTFHTTTPSPSRTFHNHTLALQNLPHNHALALYNLPHHRALTLQNLPHNCTPSPSRTFHKRSLPPHLSTWEGRLPTCTCSGDTVPAHLPLVPGSSELPSQPRAALSRQQPPSLRRTLPGAPPRTPFLPTLRRRSAQPRATTPHAKHSSKVKWKSSNPPHSRHGKPPAQRRKVPAGKKPSSF